MDSCDHYNDSVPYTPKAHNGLCPPCHQDQEAGTPLATTQHERYEPQRGAIGLTTTHIDLHCGA